MATRAQYGSMALLMLAFCACGPKIIAGTKGVRDTPENRSVYDVIETYRKAMEARDINGILALVSPQYYENASTTATSSDDYGYRELKERVLPMLLDNVKEVQYRLLVTRIDVVGDRAQADYEYWAKFNYTEGSQEGWRTLNDFNRLELSKQLGPSGRQEWKIVGGL